MDQEQRRQARPFQRLGSDDLIEKSVRKPSIGKVLERIRILAEKAGIDAKALPPTIDLKAEEVEDADE